VGPAPETASLAVEIAARVGSDGGYVVAWRTFLYDPSMGTAEQLNFRTHAGSVAFGAAAILVTLYLFTEGAAGSEDGELIYFRLIPDGSA
jgi:hypothetical protein